MLLQYYHNATTVLPQCYYSTTTVPLQHAQSRCRENLRKVAATTVVLCPRAWWGRSEPSQLVAAVLLHAAWGSPPRVLDSPQARRWVPLPQAEDVAAVACESCAPRRPPRRPRLRTDGAAGGPGHTWIVRVPLPQTDDVAAVACWASSLALSGRNTGEVAKERIIIGKAPLQILVFNTLR